MIFDTELTQDASYEVYDILGKKILEDDISKGITNIIVNLERFRDGIYFLRVQVGNASTNKKLIKKG